MGKAGTGQKKGTVVRLISSVPTGILAFDAQARAEFLSAWEEKGNEAEDKPVVRD
jgi:hypothetical protein